MGLGTSSVSGTLLKGVDAPRTLEPPTAKTRINHARECQAIWAHDCCQDAAIHQDGSRPVRRDKPGHLIGASGVASGYYKAGQASKTFALVARGLSRGRRTRKGSSKRHHLQNLISPTLCHALTRSMLLRHQQKL